MLFRVQLAAAPLSKPSGSKRKGFLFLSDPPRGYPHRAELFATGRAKFFCAYGTPRSARQAGDPQI
jgi:hypothetical protein